MNEYGGQNATHTRSPQQIVDLWMERRKARGAVIQQMMTMRDLINGDIIVPLPELDRDEKSFVQNLAQGGLDAYAQRIASVLPNLTCPPTDDRNNAAVKRSDVRKRANLSWWESSLMERQMRRRARFLLAYSTAPAAIRPDYSRDIPTWEARNPLTVFAAPPAHRDDLCPADTIYASIWTYGRLRAEYPDAARTIAPKGDLDGCPYTVLEYDDAEQITYIVVASVTANVRGASLAVLASFPNRAEIPLTVVPSRITLDRDMGQFDGLVGMHIMRAKLTALEVIAATKNVYPTMYLESRQGEVAKFISGPHEGTTGLVNEIEGGVYKELGTPSNFNTLQTIDRLERSERLAGGIPAEMGGECVDEATEILTEQGWKSYTDVSVGDLVLTLNHDTGLSQWQPIQHMNIYPAAPRRMMEMEGCRHSSLTTLNHRWPVIDWAGKRAWKFSTDLSSKDQVPLAAFNADLPVDPKWSDALVEAVAWFYTEGSRYQSGAQISQSASHNPENVERIRACLTSLMGPATQKWRDLSGCGQGGVGHDAVPRWNESPPAQNSVIKFNLSTHAAQMLDEHAPGKVPTYDFLLSLTQAQLDLFLHVSMLADNCGPHRFGQKDPARSDAFAFATILAGKGVSYRKRVKIEARDGWRAGEYTAHIIRAKRVRFVKPKENAQRGSSTFREVDFDGMVWCPTTPNGTWMARRSGSVYFTGNSASNVRTGKRGENLFSSAVDFPIQEAQETLVAAMEEENRRATKVAKAYFGNKPKSFHVKWKGAKGHVTYTPSKDFDSDYTQVEFPMTGADANNLVIAGGQRLGVGTLSKQRFMEMDPMVADADLEHDRIVSEGIEAAVLQGFQQSLASGEVTPADGARVAELVMEDNLPLFKAIIKAQAEAQERQASVTAEGVPDAVDPLAPAAQPGLGAPGMGAEAGAAIAEPPNDLANLDSFLSSMRSAGAGA